MVKNMDREFIDKRSKYNNTLETIINNMSIQILGCGEMTNKALLQKGIFFSYLLIYVQEGQLTIKHGTQKTTLQPGSPYLFVPYEIYYSSSKRGEKLKYAYIYFDIMPFADSLIFQQAVFSSGDKLFKKAWFRKAGNALEAVCCIGSSAVPGNNYSAQYRVRDIIAYILFLQIPQSLGTTTLTNNARVIINQAINYTAQQLNKPINIYQLAYDLGISHSLLARAFNHLLGLPPIKVLTAFKIHYALRLLNKGQNVSETAKALGYSSPYHFSSTFKKVMGESPSKYFKH